MIIVWLFYFYLDDYLDFQNRALIPQDNSLSDGVNARMTDVGILDQYNGHVVLPGLGEWIK